MMNNENKKKHIPHGLPILLIVVMITLLGILACGENPDRDPQPDASQPPKEHSESIMNESGLTIVALGDSLTEGYGVDDDASYPSLLQMMLKDKGYPHEVINAGVSGETSSGALSRVNWVVEHLKPDIVILETGANDGLRGIDTEIIHQNISKIVSVLKKHDIEVILAGMKMLPNLGRSYGKSFEAVYDNITRKNDVIFIPFFLKGVAGDLGLNLLDRIHPNEKGYKIVVETVYPYVINAIDNVEQKKSSNRKDEI